MLDFLSRLAFSSADKWHTRKGIREREGACTPGIRIDRDGRISVQQCFPDGFLPQMLTKERALYFGGFGLLNGMLIANHLHAVHRYVGTQVVPTAFVASCAIFCCLSASALVAKQR